MRVIAPLLLVAACNRGTHESGFASGPTGLVETSEPASSTSTGSTGLPASTGAADSTSTTAGSTSATSVADLGTPPDFGTPQPAGCNGKIDFLFAISRLHTMQPEQAALLASFDGFIETIETDFADFDAHIIVANPDGDWTGTACEGALCSMYYPNCGPNAEAYVCNSQGLTTLCDFEIGAGILWNAGAYATNYPCELAGGRRYIVAKEEPDLAQQFNCIASVGVHGPDTPMMKGIAAALTPDINGEGGCNEGFLRPDALLVIVMIMDTLDVKTIGSPAKWADKVFAAKGGDPNAVVMVAIIGPLPEEPPQPDCGYDDGIPYINPLRTYAEKFPLRVIGNICDDTFVPAFAEAATVIKEACGAFIPQ